MDKGRENKKAEIIWMKPLNTERRMEQEEEEYDGNERR